MAYNAKRWIQAHLLSLDTITTDSCIEWPFSKRRDGYGQVRWEGRVRGVPRLVLKTKLGRADFGDTRHTCDNRGCVNPRHLVAGSRSENVIDAIQRGRLTQAKLTVTDIPVIRELHRTLGTAAIARRYGVTDGAIHHVLHGLNWSHV